MMLGSTGAWLNGCWTWKKELQMCPILLVHLLKFPEAGRDDMIPIETKSNILKNKQKKKTKQKPLLDNINFLGYLKIIKSKTR